MKVLVFDLKGKFAHFRVFYANANALSYYFPPPTALTGTIASILGYERDSYYDILSPDRIRLAIRCLTPLRKRMLVVNYIMTKREKKDGKSRLKMDFRSYPTRIEIVMPKEDEFITYRIFFHAKDENLQERLKNLLSMKHSHYSIYLGLSEFLGWTEYVGEYEAKEAETKEVSTVIPYKYFDSLELSETDEIYWEKMPYAFEREGHFRKIKEVREYLFINGKRNFNFKEHIKALKVGNDFIIWL